MKIIILGAKGMLGKALKENFEKENEVFEFDKGELDITDKDKTKIKIREIMPHVVINATAYNAVDKIEENSFDFEVAQKINGFAVGYLAEICQELNITLVHYSTDFVFKGDNPLGYAEDANTDPISKYGETKVLGENLLKSSDCNFYLIRLSRLFGPAGESEQSKKSFVDIMLDLAKNKTELNLVNEEVDSPTFVNDLVKLTKKIITENLPFGIYHGANSGGCTWYEFAKEIFSHKKLSIKLNPVSANNFPRPAKRPAYSILLNTKLPSQRSWQEALREYLN